MSLIKKHLILINLPVEETNDKDDTDASEYRARQLLDEARIKSTEIVENAKQQAEELLNRALEESEEIRRKALEEAEELKRKSFEQAYQEGLKKAEDLMNMVEKALEHYEEYLHTLEKEALPLLLEVFEMTSLKLFEERLEDHGKALKINLERVFDKLKTATEVVMRLNERDYEEFGEDLKKFFLSDKKIHLRPDPGLKRSEILVETEYGIIEVSPYRILEEFLEHVEELKNEVSSETRTVPRENPQD